MRKRLITPGPQAGTLHNEGWLDLDREAVVEVTSEEKEYPVEAALGAEEMRGWRAADSGTQTIRLIFDQPQRLTRIALVFEEAETERTQEFVLRWSPDGGRSFLAGVSHDKESLNSKVIDRERVRAAHHVYT